MHEVGFSVLIGKVTLSVSAQSDSDEAAREVLEKALAMLNPLISGTGEEG